MTPSVILASASPRRKDMLERAGINIRVAIPNVAESPLMGEAPAAYAVRNASDKARAVELREHPVDEIVLAADTIVVIHDRILEKPIDADHACEMLGSLSDQSHHVMTGVCMIGKNRQGARVEQKFVATTEVVFRPLSLHEIKNYVATGEPMDKAGAYAIQGGAAAFVKSVRGSYSNVVGLPLEEVIQTLRIFVA